MSQERRGGAEIAIRAKDNDTAIVADADGTVDPSQQGWDADGLWYLGLDEEFEGQTNFYGFRLRVTDADMITSGLAENAYLFQFHSQTTSGPGCDPAAPSLPEGYNGVLDNTPAMGTEEGLNVAPLAGLLLNGVAGGGLELQFKTKTPNTSYYQSKLIRSTDAEGNSSIELKDCATAAEQGTKRDNCNVTFWRSDFGTGEEGQKEGHWLGSGDWRRIGGRRMVHRGRGNERGGQREPAGCDTSDWATMLPTELCEYTCNGAGGPELREGRYGSCKPSEGYLAVWINGEKVSGNVAVDSFKVEASQGQGANVILEEPEHCLAWCAGDEDYPDGAMKQTLPWTYGQDSFEGVATRFQTCPNYPKIGFYALGYDYAAIAASSATWTNVDDVPKLEAHFDFFRVASTVELAQEGQ